MKMKDCFKVSRRLGVMAALLAAPFVVKAEIVTLYEDDFSGSASSNLLGSVTDVGAGTWTSGGASASFKADGSVVAGSAASGVWLPLAVEQGKIYTLSADVDLTGGNWLSLGYAQYSSDGAFFSSGGYGTAIVKASSVDMFAGIGTGGKTTAYAGGSGVQQLKIVLDTTDANSANWTMEFFENGVSVAGPVTAASGDYGNIAYVGFSTADATVTGAISNFSLTVNNDPSSFSIYEDDFSGSASSNLLGTVTDVGAGTWTSSGASASFKADGSVVAGSAASGIWLPVSVAQGKIYTLSADVDLTAGSWLSLGYAQYKSDAQFTGSGGYGTVIVQSGWAKAFAGLGTGGDQGAFPGAGAGVQELSIVLDTSSPNSANWTMEFFEGGASVAGPVIAASGDYGNIAFVGFSTANATSTGTISNFSLTVSDAPVLAEPFPAVPTVELITNGDFTNAINIVDTNPTELPGFYTVDGSLSDWGYQDVPPNPHHGFWGKSATLVGWTHYHEDPNNLEALIGTINNPDLLNDGSPLDGTDKLETAFNVDTGILTLNSSGEYRNGMMQTNVFNGVSIQAAATYKLTLNARRFSDKDNNSATLTIALTSGSGSGATNLANAVSGGLLQLPVTDLPVDVWNPLTLELSGADLSGQLNVLIENLNMEAANATAHDPDNVSQVQITQVSLQVVVPEGDVNKDGVVDADDLALANSYLDGSIDGGDSATNRQDVLIASGSTPAEALAILNLTDFDIDGDGYFDSVDVGLIDLLIVNPPVFVQIDPAGGLMEFRWNSNGGQLYDLESTVVLNPADWQPYNDGVTTYTNIPPSGSGTNVLTDVLVNGAARFFRILEK